tara:strand:- start:14210 stop:15826 length:1617 start_codon:yes stop_codon:yes gene_type:complete
MKYLLLLPIFFSLFLMNNVIAQDEFSIAIVPYELNGALNVHSFSWGKTSDGKWLIIGGRIDGLHQRQPFAAFLESSNNKKVFLIDTENNQTWNTSLNVLPASIYEQLQATNQEFYQRDNVLYIIGGYGYSATQDEHLTYSNLTAIDIDGLANAIISDSDITSYFRQITDPNLAVTGGQLGYLNDTFYLCGGQFFEGRYNPMGPGSGPGFTQEYSDEIRTFKIIDNGNTLSLENYNAIHDTENLHRRDYNMAPQIFPNGESGFTMFSGVFQEVTDLPFLNSVNITSSGYTVNNDFNQYLSQYHSATIPIFDEQNNRMHTIFFGGMSQFTLDENENLIEDINVPFVKTISKVTRFSDGSMTESKLDIEMPTLLGSGAEFIPINNDLFFTEEGIVNLTNLPDGDTLLGYIYGGIESTQENIFFINNGTQSSASNQIFKVYINKNILGTEENTIGTSDIYNVKIFPNPLQNNITIDLFIPTTDEHTIEVNDLLGRTIKSIKINKTIGNHSVKIDLTNISSGEYILSIKSNLNYFSNKIIIKQ